jgi:iron-sulfur cluster assembly accessory protein
MITLTPVALNEVKRLMIDQALEGEKLSLRVAIQGGGCSGFKWKLIFVPDEPSAKDIVLEQDGVRILVDQRSSLYVNGTKIDYLNDLNKRGFLCTNDKIKGNCGCGSSFSV